MRTIAKAAVGLFAALLLGSAQGQELMPDVLVKNVTPEVVELIAKDKEIRGNRNKLIQLIDEKVLPHFNFGAMTALERHVLHQHVGHQFLTLRAAEQKS